ncbi:hypothetical protein C8Q78DRAFT_1076940 [Trametes maxima]|nr:hypothetical protein C8Q78DRAFT_1076940 [Trametes maxima]
MANGNGAQRKSSAAKSSNSLEADIALLSNLLSQNVDESDPDVAEILRRLEAAEGIADGVESRLDGIMDHLDSLLGNLEARTTPNRSKDATVSAVAVARVGEEVVVATSVPDSGGEPGKK